MRKLGYFLRGRLLPCTLLSVSAAAAGIALAVWLPFLLAPVAAAERIFSFVVAISVILSDGIPEAKIAKLLLLFLPWTGAVLCLVFRAPAARSEREDLGHGAPVCRHMAKNASYFSVGKEMCERLLADLKAAKERIYLEYYIIAQGKFWGEILEVLKARAKDGADVRVICDGFGCCLTLPKHFARDLARFGIRAAVYRPLRFGRGFSRRDHTKLAVIDDAVYVGGINLADEYIGEKIRFGHWKDTAVRLQGDISPFCERFLRTWYALRPSDGLPAVPEFQGGDIPFYPLSDEGTKRTFPKVLLLTAARARTYLYLCTPYLSLPHALLGALFSAAAAGTDIRILIPHIPDKKPVFFLTRAYARLIGERGIEVREYTPGFLHAKSIVADGKLSLVSSCNLDFRSLYVQAECGAAVEDEALAARLTEDFLSAWKQSVPVKKTNAFVRAAGRIAMLFAPLT